MVSSGSGCQRFLIAYRVIYDSCLFWRGTPVSCTLGTSVAKCSEPQGQAGMDMVTINWYYSIILMCGRALRGSGGLMR